MVLGAANEIGHAAVTSSPLWPNAVVPYVLAPDLSPDVAQKVAAAIQLYTDRTPIRWIARTNQANM